MKFVINKEIGDKKRIKVVIRLNDECDNGHQDFSITGDIIKNGSHITGGSIHKEILKYFPEFEIFVKLHLSDFKGIPMYAIQNGFYHLKSDMTENDFCEYYRIDNEVYHKLSKTNSEREYHDVLIENDVLKKWEETANQGIELLEKLTGEKFVNTSRRTNLKVFNNI